MAGFSVAQIPRRVQRAAVLIKEMEPQEVRQLIKLAPILKEAAIQVQQKPTFDKDHLTQIKEYFQSKMASLGKGNRPFQAEDSFISGTTWGEFLALTEEEQRHLWEAQFTWEIDDFEDHNVRADAEIPA